MLLFTFTKSSIAVKLGQVNIEEPVNNAFFMTVFTDDSLTTVKTDAEKILVEESPLKGSDALVYIRITYDKRKENCRIFKSTISGRPVYYHINENGEFFCSTHVSMLRKAGVKIEENTEALPELFVYRFVMPPRTLYKNIHQLTPGCTLKISPVGQICKITALEEYIPPEQDSRNNDFDKVTREIRDILVKSMGELKPYKDNFAFLLSGGLDSSILFKICESLYGTDVAYSTEYPFEDPAINQERKYAETAAAAFSITKHTHYKATVEDYLHGLLRSISTAEEPLHHFQSVMFYLLFKAGISQSDNFVICGQGADTIWAFGFLTQFYRSKKLPYSLLSKYPVLRLINITSTITGRAQSAVESCRIRETCPVEDPRHIIWAMGSYGDEDWACKYFIATRHDLIKNRLNGIKRFLDRPLYDVITLLEFLGGVSYTQTIWSKLGQSQHKILYYPYNQYELLNYAFRVPWDMKLKKPKNVLRGLARQLEIPEFIITRRKSGFGVRRKDWAEVGGFFDSIIPLAAKVFEESQIRALQSSNPRKAWTFWTALNYSIWKRICVNNETVESLLEELPDKAKKT